MRLKYMEIKPIKRYHGKVAPLFHNNIDTDQIIPKTHLKRITKTGFGQFLFDEWRYLDDGSPNPDFILNQPEYVDASILITGDNFGCGSSREHAAWALKDFGITIVIAGSFSDIFYMNCTKNGILPIKLEQKDREDIIQHTFITIDLPKQIIELPNRQIAFDIDKAWKYKLEHGLDDIDLTLQYETEIEKYELQN